MVADSFGSDDGPVKRDLKTRDWSRTSECALYAWTNAAKGRGLADRVRHFARVAVGGHTLARELVRVRCHRGADIATQLGFPESTADAIRCLDEHWDGRGKPHGFAGDAIPLAARIAGLAQTLEVFLTSQGPFVALDKVKERQGTWFDPALVDVCLRWKQDHAWWSDLLDDDLATRVQAMEPGEHARILDGAGLDRVAEAFAEIIDAKSPYTSAHSTNVARFACGIGETLGMEESSIHSLYRAALLHDVGKLGVSNRILDKAAPLTAEEREVMAQHPLFSWSILRRVGAFRDFAWTASLHHERLDGSGYPWCVGDDELDVSARVLAIADVYEALTARRPYRDGLPIDEALRIIGKDTPFRYDGRVFTALERWLAR
jgi:HD-GYP domain-containing protein (c-di-GMP phosphodiesterase class II)